ncbi:hypothetical protein NC796_15290 [Aliifodinibius sp. S!AR15-10]|uniref:hypothetical protein n=1 Tax=Aliifodinibius sp. S!AR15-10 TaxID=2950437 RepID=UPI0028673913|nr:hypothetical protein [Aliifodinibius sp. S!AR15-10]MDR8392518.1 hypothetical protein [Aliifodinibius sp. S!AR15-10]
MNRKVLLIFSFALISCCYISCEQKSAYEQLVDRHYQKGTQNDSLFLGYHFGMTRDEFYDHSWKLNSQKVVREGNNNESVRYEVDNLKSRAKKNFYPLFHQDSIYSMPVKYSYTGWAPWNKDLWADSLEQDILKVFQERYNNRFQKMTHPEKGVPAHILIDGNKRIAIYQMDDNMQVAVVYTDLDVLSQIQKAEEE